MGKWYFLKNRKVYPYNCDLINDPEKFIELHSKFHVSDNNKNRRVRNSYIGNVEVSTVFLGLDHGYDGRCLLFETMIFGGNLDNYCARCSTWRQALNQHREALNELTNI